MNKYYFFLANGDIKRDELSSALDGLGLPYEINYLSNEKGYLLADETFAVMKSRYGVNSQRTHTLSFTTVLVHYAPETINSVVVHVLEMCGYDPKVYSGFAFGIGIERVAILRYGVDDIRRFYQNDVRFIKDFSEK